MRIPLYILALFLVVACKTTSDTGKNQLKELSFKTISKGELYGAGSEGIEKSNLVITNQKDWHELLAKMEKVNKLVANFKELPINFSEEMVIGVFDKMRSSGGYTTSIQEISLNKEVVTVVVEMKNPTGVQATVMTQPYHLVKIKKRKEEVLFSNEDK